MSPRGARRAVGSCRGNHQTRGRRDRLTRAGVLVPALDQPTRDERRRGVIEVLSSASQSCVPVRLRGGHAVQQQLGVGFAVRFAVSCREAMSFTG